MNPRTARPRRDALPAVGCNGGEFFYAPRAPGRALCSRHVNTTPRRQQNPLPLRDAILWGIAALAISLLFAAVVRPTIGPSSDLWDHSQAARQVARGDGFTSLYTYPALLGAKDHAPFPERWRMPLYAVRGALALRMGFKLPDAFLLVGVQAHAVLVALVFLLGAHFHSRRAGSIAAACAIASPLFLDAYNPGVSQLPVATVGLVVWLLLLRGKGVGTVLLAAVPAAAAWYLRAEALLLAPLWIWAASSGSAGWPRGAIFAGALATLCVPWMPTLLSADSGASGLLGRLMLLYTPEYPGYSSWRMYGASLPGAFEYALRHPLSLAIRWGKDVVGFGLDLSNGLGPIAAGFGIAGLLLRDAKERYAPFRPMLPFVAAIALTVAAFAAVERGPRHLVPVAPLACVLVGVAAAPALDRFSGRRVILAAFALLLLERGATVAFQTRDVTRRAAPMPRETLAALAPRAAAWPKDALLLTDAPDWAAWHLDRPALLLPLHRDLAALLRDHDAAAIFLSPGARGRNATDGDTAWVGIWDRSEAVEGFRGPEALPGGARLYVRDAGARRSELTSDTPSKMGTPPAIESQPGDSPSKDHAITKTRNGTR